MRLTRRELLGGAAASGLVSLLQGSNTRVAQTIRTLPPVFLVGDLPSTRNQWTTAIKTAASEVGWNKGVDIRFLSDCDRSDAWQSQSELGAFRAAYHDTSDTNLYLTDLSGAVVASDPGSIDDREVLHWIANCRATNFWICRHSWRGGPAFFDYHLVDKLIWSLGSRDGIADAALETVLGHAHVSPFSTAVTGPTDLGYRGLTVLLPESRWLDAQIADALQWYPHVVLVRTKATPPLFIESSATFPRRGISNAEGIPEASSTLSTMAALSRFAVETSLQIAKFEDTEFRAGAARVGRAAYEFFV